MVLDVTCSEPREPTADQCSREERVYETVNKVGYAIWYPQMGGYVGKAVAICDKQWERNDVTGVGIGGCIDVYIWHDGSLPFREEEGSPIVLHHCDPEQFVKFGQTLAKLNKQGLLP